MPTYQNLTAGELNAQLASSNIDEAGRREIINYLTSLGVYHSGPNSTATVETTAFDTGTTHGVDVLELTQPFEQVPDGNAPQPSAPVIVDTADANFTADLTGNHLIVLGNGNDQVNLGSSTGHETVVTGSGNDAIYAGAGPETIYSGTGADFDLLCLQQRQHGL